MLGGVPSTEKVRAAPAGRAVHGAGRRCACRAARRRGGPHVVRRRAGRPRDADPHGVAHLRARSPPRPRRRRPGLRHPGPARPLRPALRRGPRPRDRRRLRVRRPRAHLRPDRHRPARHRLAERRRRRRPTRWPARLPTSSCPTPTRSRSSDRPTSQRLAGRPPAAAPDRASCCPTAASRSRSASRPTGWPSFDARDDAVEQGRKALQDLLVTDAELAELRRRAASRPREGTAPSPSERRRGPTSPTSRSRPSPHARRGLRLTLLELAAWLGHEPHSDLPTGVSPVLAGHAAVARRGSRRPPAPGAQALRGPAGRHDATRAAAGRLAPASSAGRAAGLAGRGLAGPHAGAGVAAGGGPRCRRRRGSRRCARARATSTCRSCSIGSRRGARAARPPRRSAVDDDAVGGLGAHVRDQRLGGRIRGGVGRGPRRARRRPPTSACARSRAAGPAPPPSWRTPAKPPSPRWPRPRGAARDGRPVPSSRRQPTTPTPGTRSCPSRCPPRSSARRAGVAARLGMDRDAVENDLEAADAAAIDHLAAMVRAGRRPAAPLESARAAAAASVGGGAWTAVQELDPRRPRRRGMGRRLGRRPHCRGPRAAPRRARSSTAPSSWRSPARPAGLAARVTAAPRWSQPRPRAGRRTSCRPAAVELLDDLFGRPLRRT